MVEKDGSARSIIFVNMNAVVGGELMKLSAVACSDVAVMLVKPMHRARTLAVIAHGKKYLDYSSPRKYQLYRYSTRS
jgi:hypothetical protein